MDWNRAIAINQAALARILAEVVALLGFTVGKKLERVPRPVYFEALRLLRPAEAALRRLIVIAARGLVMKVVPAHPMPKGLVIVASQTGAARFQLYDRRKVFTPNRVRYTRATPRVHFFGADTLVPVFAPAPTLPDDSVNATSLLRRLATAQEALANLPRQALRLARWKARRARMEKAKFTQPLRPGRPPGHRSKGQDGADLVLKECHWLARDVLREELS